MIRERLLEAVFHFIDFVLHDLDGFRQELFRLVRAGRFDAICITKGASARDHSGLIKRGKRRTDKVISYSAQPDPILELVMPQHFPANGIQSRVGDDDLCLFPCTLVIDEIHDARRETLLEFRGELWGDLINDLDVR